MERPNLNPVTASTRSQVLAATGLLAAVLFIVAGTVTDSYWLRMITKPVPVLAMAYWVSTLPVRGRYQLAISIGLLLSALGDILLEAGSGLFLFGLIAFLLGHVAYVVAFTRDSRRLTPLWAAAAYSYGAIIFAVLFLTGEMASMTIPVLIYIVVICTMLWRASSRVGTAGVLPFSAWAGLVGALFFVASDTILALRMFDTPIDLGRTTVIITYWIGQLGITLSAWRPTQPKART